VTRKRKGAKRASKMNAIIHEGKIRQANFSNQIGTREKSKKGKNVKRGEGKGRDRGNATTKTQVTKVG